MMDAKIPTAGELSTRNPAALGCEPKAARVRAGRCSPGGVA
jgi:hypothetical protein